MRYRACQSMPRVFRRDLRVSCYACSMLDCSHLKSSAHDVAFVSGLNFSTSVGEKILLHNLIVMSMADAAFFLLYKTWETLRVF
ncbi:hypothetical protein PHYBLDRAFT_157982 [Phycomyces blakesleeanus NRRL 1555(-)]|uniref:Uncharacterized protein n=1 Tax=Phycomyces blakesleeanus (strain ATCC 8743b / DSM 1359 / FGSC 10004 / NBRC 33097 / NRRL 1555) TaxID=763407 RepID=A0A167NVJ0_PHYB8|nr:hypothetical protein PHYBLDRAFT_157982 [Phycomyces blakesleeanus NRRL 1555(-)]OAD76699.1 hypothetical protein PHYBLDRAFT_157982 [Phycomyces blakesleeanus NRRL 1555(-)]|eukprot:XP_018294739.1 hypothetical protein PHYBLDRAFT_157982 [Phycomyces blakesleeanus NRRL 1555(-)]